MARLFTAANTEYFEADTAVFTAPPFAVFAAFYPLNATSVLNAFWVGDKDVTAENWRVLQLRGDVAGDPLEFHSQDGTNDFLRTTNGFTANQWNYGLAVANTASDRRIYMNGGGKNTSTATITPVGADRTSIGRAGDSTPDGYFSGRIAYVVVWTGAGAVFTDAEANAITSGRIHPLKFRRASVAAYWPLPGKSGINAIDYSGNGLHLTDTNTVTAADNAPIRFYEGLGGLLIPQVIAAGTTQEGAGTSAATSNHSAQASAIWAGEDTITGTADTSSVPDVTRDASGDAGGTAATSGIADVTRDAQVTVTATSGHFADGDTTALEEASGTVPATSGHSGQASAIWAGEDTITGTADTSSIPDVTRDASGDAGGTAATSGIADVTRDAQVTVTATSGHFADGDTTALEEASGTVPATSGHSGQASAIWAAQDTVTGTVSTTGDPAVDRDASGDAGGIAATSPGQSVIWAGQSTAAATSGHFADATVSAGNVVEGVGTAPATSGHSVQGSAIYAGASTEAATAGHSGQASVLWAGEGTIPATSGHSADLTVPAAAAPAIPQIRQTITPFPSEHLPAFKLVEPLIVPLPVARFSIAERLELASPVRVPGPGLRQLGINERIGLVEALTADIQPQLRGTTSEVLRLTEALYLTPETVYRLKDIRQDDSLEFALIGAALETKQERFMQEVREQVAVDMEKERIKNLCYVLLDV